MKRKGHSRATDGGNKPRRGTGVILAALIALLLLGGLASCNGDNGNGDQGIPGYTDIGPDELADMLEDKDFLFINTHIPYEGEIPQTDLFIPYDEAADHVDELPDDKDAKIVVYCQSDRMSRIAADEWADLGYTNLYNLEGGFVAWRDAGYEFIEEGEGAQAIEDAS